MGEDGKILIPIPQQRNSAFQSDIGTYWKLIL